MQQADGGKREWQPVKYTVTPGPDMRNSKLGPRGYKAKRKREIEEEIEQHMEETADMMEDAPAQPQVQSAKRQRVEGAPYRAVSVVAEQHCTGFRDMLDIQPPSKFKLGLLLP